MGFREEKKISWKILSFSIKERHFNMTDICIKLRVFTTIRHHVVQSKTNKREQKSLFFNSHKQGIQ